MDQSMRLKKLTLGQKIKALRKQRGLTQEELAIRSQVSYTTLTKIENEGIKNPSFDSVVAISRGLSVSLENLIITRND